MKRALVATAAAVICVTTAGVAAVAVHAAAPAAVAASGQHVDDFQLTDHTKMAYQLYYYKYTPAIVLMTRTNGSAFSQAATAQLQKISDAYKDKGVLFLMMDSNTADNRDAVAAEADKTGVKLPILMDEDQLVGEQLGVKKEGEVFVIDPKTWTVAYRGSVANTAKAVDAVIAGTQAPASVAVAGGKAITLASKAKSADFTKISYTNEVAPIIQDKCVSCHVKGGIGPFTMDSYEKIKGFAPMIRETIRTKRMPPYFADPHIGHFQNDQGLTDDQTKTLVHWIEAGMPRGTGADPLLANKDKVAPEWPAELGKPDTVVTLPAFNVPANGLVEYQEMYVDNPFKSDTWLRAISIKPGNRAVLHHVVSDWQADPKAPKADIPGGSVGSYTPGARPQVMAAGAGAPVPAGGKLHFQMHYTTNGKAATDVTEVGFYTLKAPPTYIKRSVVIANLGLYIPAGEARHVETAYLTFPADAYIYTLYPHSHYRGMHVELDQITTDGKRTPLIVLPKYDFNWQRDYDPVQPILVKAGTKLVATWVYDNSVHNKANPDPKRNVSWGEQTPDEMMYFRINYRFADETVSHPRNDLQDQLSGASLIGGLDANMDGKISPDELKGPLAALKPMFSKLDANHDGFLDAKELSVVMQMMMQQQSAATPGV
jgi:peroxiredoxin